MGYSKGYMTPLFMCIAVAGILIIADIPTKSVDVNLSIDIEYGVSAHNVTQKDIEMMVDAKFSWIRLDAWNGFEKTVNESVAAGMKVLGIMEYPNVNDVNLSGWDKMVTDYTVAADGKVQAWEILNEPLNFFPFMNLTEFPEKMYFDLMKSAYGIIKGINSSIDVIGFGGIRILDNVIIDYQWLKDLIHMGALQYCDAISIHFYTTSNDPHEIANDLRQTIGNMRSLVGNMPIWVTETGQPSFRNQTSFISAVYPVLASEGIVHVFWYDFRDWIPYNGMYFGLVHKDFQPRHSYEVFADRFS